MKNYLSLISFVFVSTIVLCQNTVGLLSYSPGQSYDGFNLFYPSNQPNTYLLDNCGEIVHIWEDEDIFQPGNSVYLTEEGLLYRAKRDARGNQDPIFAGGAGEIIEIRDWDNNLIWAYTLNDKKYRLHHDIALTPEGTLLAIAWELKTNAECAEAGRDTTTLSQAKMWPDFIIELDPAADSIIWEWHAWDHLIQDFDSTKNNYGVVADHPELIDVNYGREDGHPDWMHANSIDYNAELDQILLSVPYFDEIWIIDHSTTTEEAAGSFGGFGNRGGDLMYRWGNPASYRQGTEADQQLFFQHDAHWIDDHLEPTHPQYGKIAVFNNRIGANYSLVSVITPPWVMYDQEYTFGEDSYLPETYDFNLTHPVDSSFLFSTGLSGSQFLPNGNTLILAGRIGYTFELTPDNDIVWEYVTPIRDGNQVAQGTTLGLNNNLTFRFNRFPLEFPAFEGRELESMGWLELEPNETFCDQILPTADLLDESAFTVYPNPVTETLTVEWAGMMSANVELTTLLGQAVFSAQAVSGGRTYIDVSDLEAGIYLLNIDREYARKVVVE